MNTETKELKLVKSTQFNGAKLDCYWQTGDEKGDFWATREQIGRLLGYATPDIAIANIHKRNQERLDKFSTLLKMSKVEGNRTVTRDVIVYNFKGLLEICRYSNQPKANAVMDFLWNVADDIRVYGFFATPENLEKFMSNPDVWIKFFTYYKAAKDRVKELEVQREKDKPKILFAEAVSDSKDAILVGNFAKILKQNGINIGPNRLFEWFRENGYLIKRTGEMWNMPTQRSLNAGLFIIKKSVAYDKDGNAKVYHTPKITPKGQIFFVNQFLANKSKQLELIQ